MQKYRAYEIYFLIALPVLLLSLIWNWLQLVYVIIFFLATLDLIFITTPIDDKTNHSSVNYYERSSRWNWFNYVLIVLLIIEAFMFTIIPVGQGFVILASWAINILMIRKLSTAYGATIFKSMLMGYLKQQMPNVEPHKFDMAYEYINRSEFPSAKDLALFAGVSEQTADDIIHYYSVYTQSNFTK